MAKEKEKIVLFQMNVSVLDWDRSEFAVCVVGIRENHPRVDIGDIMHLREVLVEWRRGSGTAFEGRITMLRKREGFIRTRIFYFTLVLSRLTSRQISVALNYGNTSKHIFLWHQASKSEMIFLFSAQMTHSHCSSTSLS